MKKNLTINNHSEIPYCGLGSGFLREEDDLSYDDVINMILADDPYYTGAYAEEVDGSRYQYMLQWEGWSEDDFINDALQNDPGYNQTGFCDEQGEWYDA